MVRIVKGDPSGMPSKQSAIIPDAIKKIDRGLSFVCGSMHGSDEVSCEKYFCEKHKTNYVLDPVFETTVCDACAKALLDSGEWEEDEDEGALVRKIKS